MPKFQVGDTLVSPLLAYTAEVLEVGKTTYKIRWSDNGVVSHPIIDWIDFNTHWTKKEEDTTMADTAKVVKSSLTERSVSFRDEGDYVDIRFTNEDGVEKFGLYVNRAELLAALNAVDAPVPLKPLPSGIGAVIRSKLSKQIFVRADFNLWAGSDDEGNLPDSAFSTSDGKRNWDEFYEVLSDGVEL